MKKISNDVLAVLSGAETEGATLKLTGQLDRKLYAETNKVLEAAGGKWSKNLKAHVFSGDAAAYIEDILLTGEYATPKQDFGQFDTPGEVADVLISVADISPGMHVLEPSAGLGNLARRAIDEDAIVDIVETDAGRWSTLNHAISLIPTEAARKVQGLMADFLTLKPSDFERAPYDRVVMNPPFAKGADIAHVRHAYDFLKPSGRLVAIMSPGFTFRQDRKFAEFREWLRGLEASWNNLPDNAFKASGTSVNTVMLTIDKRA